MSAKNRIPNILKFRMVYSDRILIEGTTKCSDEQANKIWSVLFPREGQDNGIAESFATPPTKASHDPI